MQRAGKEEKEEEGEEKKQLLDVLVEPGESLKETVSCDSAGLDDVPAVVLELRETEFFGDLVSVHSLGEVALVGKDEEDCVLHLAVADDAHELSAGLFDTLTIAAVDDKDESLSASKVVAPERTDLVLASDIPHVELDLLVGHCLNVETDSGDGGHVLAQFELVENGCLASRIKAEHKHTHLLVAKELRKQISHFVSQKKKENTVQITKGD